MQEEKEVKEKEITTFASYGKKTRDRKWTTMMIRCSKCHAGLNLTDGVVLWLCPVCGEYGTAKSFARDDYPQCDVRSASEYGMAII